MPVGEGLDSGASLAVLLANSFSWALRRLTFSDLSSCFDTKPKARCNRSISENTIPSARGSTPSSTPSYHTLYSVYVLQAQSLQWSPAFISLPMRLEAERAGTGQIRQIDDGRCLLGFWPNGKAENAACSKFPKRLIAHVFILSCIASCELHLRQIASRSWGSQGTQKARAEWISHDRGEVSTAGKTA